MKKLLKNLVKKSKKDDYLSKNQKEIITKIERAETLEALEIIEIQEEK